MQSVQSMFVERCLGKVIWVGGVVENIVNQVWYGKYSRIVPVWGSVL